MYKENVVSFFKELYKRIPEDDEENNEKPRSK
jgi:hypothetical protein